jgi:hypothetical protein
VCFLTLVISLCSLWWNPTKRLFKTCAFMASWFCCFKPSSQVDGHHAWFHNHIVVHLQIPYQVVIGCIGCITPINCTSKFGLVLCPMDILHGNQNKATTFKIEKTKLKNLMWELTL